MLTDPIADILIRIKNGYQARKEIVEVPYSKIKEGIVRIMIKEGYLKGYQIKEKKGRGKSLEMGLKYLNKRPALTELKRVSKPGLRIYSKASLIPRVKLGFGITIVSTPQGLMTEKEAKKKKLGGEVICQIW